MRVTFRQATMALAAAATCGCASEKAGLGDDVSLPPPETAIEYEAVLEGVADEDIAALLTESLSIFRLSGNGAPSPAFLTRRLEGDKDIAQTVLKSEGFYSGEYAYEIRPPETPEGQTEPPKDGKWTAVARVDSGPAFTLVSHDMTLTTPAPEAPSLDAAGLGSPVGKRARAEEILDAESAAVVRLKNNGFYYASRENRRALADLEEHTIEVETSIAPGPFVRYGEMSFEGADSVDHDYLSSYKNWIEGDPVRRRRLDEYQRELSQTGLFSSVSVRLPETPEDLEPGGVAPVTVTAEERPPRTVSAGARFNTNEGPSLRASFQHRNLLGAGENLRANADISQVEPKIELDFRKPQYLRDEQALIASSSAKYRDDDVYTGFTIEAALGLERRLDEHWTVGIGGSLGYDDISAAADGAEGKAYLLGAPMFAAFDDTDDLLNPTRGLRLRANVTPYSGVYANEAVAYLVVDGTASTYYDIGGDGRWVFAARGRLGSVLSGKLDTTSPTKRLYSGGGGSVRGYQRDFIGPLDDDDNPTGGLSVVEAGAELRMPVVGDLGAVLFFEGGSVSTEVVPNFEEEVQWATGLGFRYYSPVGPIRLDIGVPVNPRDVDNDFEFYFSIGQAF